MLVVLLAFLFFIWREDVKRNPVSGMGPGSSEERGEQGAALWVDIGWSAGGAGGQRVPSHMANQGPGRHVDEGNCIVASGTDQLF